MSRKLTSSRYEEVKALGADLIEDYELVYPLEPFEIADVLGVHVAIHFGRLAKRIPGQPNSDPSKSTITVSLPRLQELVESKGGTGMWRGNNKEVVDFGVTIGTYRNPGSSSSIPTSWGTVHYPKAGAHVVPAKPRPSRGGTKR